MNEKEGDRYSRVPSRCIGLACAGGHGRTPAGKIEDDHLPHSWYLAEGMCRELVIGPESSLNRHRSIESPDTLGLQAGWIYRSIWTGRSMRYRR
jgi:hypothetical protein